MHYAATEIYHFLHFSTTNDPQPFTNMRYLLMRLRPSLCISVLLCIIRLIAANPVPFDLTTHDPSQPFDYDDLYDDRPVHLSNAPNLVYYIHYLAVTMQPDSPIYATILHQMWVTANNAYFNYLTNDIPQKSNTKTDRFVPSTQTISEQTDQSVQARIYVKAGGMLPWRAVQHIADTINEDGVFRRSVNRYRFSAFVWLGNELVGIVVVGPSSGVVNQLSMRWAKSQGRDMAILGAAPLVV